MSKLRRDKSANRTNNASPATGQAGFTIVELMISTAVFTTVLLLCGIAIIQVGNMFYKGITINRTQDVARNVSDDVSQSIQFGVAGSGVGAAFMIPGSAIYGTTNVQSYCLGDVRYSYATGKSLGDQISHGLWRDRPASIGTCTPVDLTSGSISGGEELLGDHMRLSSFVVTHDSSGRIWTLNMLVAYGDDDLFTDGTFSECKGLSGSQFCATVPLKTDVLKRL